MASRALKQELLELLKRDEEFRYAVIGLLGLDEFRKNLEQIWMDIRKIWQNIERIWKELEKLREGQEELRRGQEGLRREISELREGQEGLRREISELREGQERIWDEVRGLKRWQERLAISLEEEAWEVVSYRVGRRFKAKVRLSRLFAEGEEFDIYGVSEDFCVIGEATVRLGTGKLRSFLRKVERLKGARPDLFRKKTVFVIYTSIATDAAVKEAERWGVWIATARRNLTKPKIHRFKLN